MLYYNSLSLHKSSPLVVSKKYLFFFFYSTFCCTSKLSKNGKMCYNLNFHNMIVLFLVVTSKVLETQKYNLIYTVLPIL